MNQIDKQMFVRILNSEMELATGCTEPGAVALTAAEAGAALRKAGGTRVEAVTVRASINIIKNAMSQAFRAPRIRAWITLPPLVP